MDKYSLIFGIWYRIRYTVVMYAMDIASSCLTVVVQVLCVGGYILQSRAIVTWELDHS